MALAQQMGSAFTFLGVLFLVFSHTQMIVRAQQAAINSTSSGGGSLTPQEMAQLLSGMFKDISSNLNTGQVNSTTPVSAFNATGTLRQAINAVAAQQQSLGIGPLQNAASDIAAFLELPSTLGTGANIKLFQTRISQFRTLAQSVKTLLPAEQYLTIRRDLDQAAALSLQFVSAFPLAQLSYVSATTSLASAVVALIASIFFITAASLGLAGQIGGLQAAKTLTGNSTNAVERQQWFQDLTQQATTITTPVLALAFSNSSLQVLDVANNLLDLSQSSLSSVPSNIRFTISELGTNLLG